MAKLTLQTITSGYADTALITANNALIEAALENTLSRDGTTPNTMSADLDMNSRKVINLAAPTAATDAARFVDITTAGLPDGIPAQTGNAGKILQTDGTTASWQTKAVTASQITDATANGQGIITAANYAAMRTLLSLGALALLNTVGTSEVDANSITLAKLAHEFGNGGLLYGDASGVPTALSVGTSGQVLSSDGTIPSWDDASGLELESVTTITGDPTEISFTDLVAGYDYHFLFRGVLPATDNVTLLAQTSANNGSSYDGSASNYQYTGSYTAVGTEAHWGSSADTKMQLSVAQGNGAEEYMDADLVLREPGASRYTTLTMMGTYTDNDSPAKIRLFTAAGHRDSAAAVDAIQFSLSSGAFANVGKIIRLRRKLS